MRARRRRLIPPIRSIEILLLVWLSILLITATAAAQVRVVRVTQRMSGGELGTLLREGRGVALDAVRIVGSVDLAGVSVQGSFRCRGCTFTGDIDARDAIFSSVVIIEGSRFLGRSDFTAATFNDTVVFRRYGMNVFTSFDDNVLFSLARFDEPAVFDQVHFRGDAQFIGTRFLSDSSFAETEFEAKAFFGLAKFDGPALFSGQPVSPGLDLYGGECGSFSGAFRGDVRFARASFGGHTDFTQRCFQGTANFERTTFAQGSDFSLGRFASTASFDRARFLDAAFVDTEFQAPVSAREVRAKTMTFDAATLTGIDLTRSIISERVSFENTELDGVVSLLDLRAGLLFLPIEALDRLDDDTDRERTLRTMSRSAESEGNLESVMEIEFLLAEEMTDATTGAMERLFRRYIGGDVAGYFVRPMNPLKWLGRFLLAGFLLRLFFGVARTHPWSLRRPARAVNDTFSNAIGKKPRIDADFGFSDLPVIVEWLATKALFACFVIALAKSNPTLKQLLDAVTP